MDTEGTLCAIKGDSGEVQNIRSSLLTEASKTMGLLQSLTGDNTRQVEELISKHTPTINKLLTSDMTRRIVWKGFLGAVWSSVKYGMST